MRYLDYLENKINRGIWSFSSKEMADEIGFSPKDKLAVFRKNGRIMTPAKGFHVIIPEEYVQTGRLPVDRYIDSLMAYYSKPYYVGLLTAASYWGASHQSPMSFQVITDYNRRNIKIGRDQILFFRKKDMGPIPVSNQKSPTGYFNISSPEMTFFDFVLFNRQVGGLDYVVEILFELAEQFSVNEIRKAAQYFPNAIVQRGAYLLEISGLDKYCYALDKYFEIRRFIYAYLNPSKSQKRKNKHTRWKLFINDELELEG